MSSFWLTPHWRRGSSPTLHASAAPPVAAVRRPHHRHTSHVPAPSPASPTRPGCLTTARLDGFGGDTGFVAGPPRDGKAHPGPFPHSPAPQRPRPEGPIQLTSLLPGGSTCRMLPQHRGPRLYQRGEDTRTPVLHLQVPCLHPATLPVWPSRTQTSACREWRLSVRPCPFA
ncbi:hypothetical protein NDU88_001153 [Pleurodeles waltl]|uniref:Uncharacterized protein n=1 Tax=Pleurodeles waltl TaxID=8319 RepID=A0AAV7LCA6_PLEWA|nr:hypothetical protein NDU88_001153 [Pleurodeles waltl]